MIRHLHLSSINDMHKKIKPDQNASDSLFEVVDFTLHNGKVVQCAKRGSTLIAFTKIEIYACGKVQKHDESMLKRLQQMKQTRRKEYDIDPSNEANLEKQKRIRYNYQRSQEMFKSLKKVGMSDSPSNINQIIDHLLAVGEQVTAKTKRDKPSQLEAPKGSLRVFSTWAIMKDGTKYLSTLKFIPGRLSE